LQLVRRLDWRFLLPAATLGRVAIAGRDLGELARALGASATSVTDLGRAAAAGTLVGEAGFDGIVLRGAPLAHAPAVRGLLRPGGWVYWEFEAWPAPLPRRRAAWSGVHSPARARRLLAAAGFEAVMLHWHRPSFARCMDIVPLGERVLIDAVLGRASERRSKRAAAALAQVLQSAGWLERVLPAWSAIAYAPGAVESGTRGPNAAAGANRRDPSGCRPLLQTLLDAERTAWQMHAGTPVDEIAIAYRTPRFRASGHVLGFVHARGENAPRVVAKMARLPGDAAALELEAANLGAAHAHGEVPGASVPRCITCVAWRGSHVLLETAVPGSPLSPPRVRRDAAGWSERVTRWLAALHGATRGPALGPHGVNHCVHEAFASLHAAGGQLASLAARTAAVLPEELAALPAVLEHGDLASPNVLADEHGELSVVDWEQADPAGLPAADLFFFLNYAAGARDGATSVAARVRAYHAALIAPDGWARRFVAGYATALQLPASVLPALLLVAWPRVVARLRARVQAGEGTGLESERYVALWRHTLEHREAVRFTS
jgi:aminoglycoside phosphotransferase